MKLIFIFLLIFFLQCSSGKNVEQVSNSATTPEKTQSNSVDVNKNNDMPDKINSDLKYKIDLKVIENNLIEINYSVENTSEDEDYLVFNMGDTNKGFGNRLVYIEPMENGLVELSQRKFTEPENKTCPKFEVAVEAGAIWLKAKKSIEHKVLANLPLKLNTPFDQCTPNAEMPTATKEVKFCLGVAKADSTKVRVTEQGYVEGWENVSEQELLCSERVNL